MKKLKLWQKQYLCTLIVFLFALYGCVFFLADSSFAAGLNGEKAAAKSEQAMLARAIRSEQAAVAARGGASPEASAAIAKAYGDHYGRRGVMLQFSLSTGETLYSSMPPGLPQAAVGTMGVVSGADHVRYLCITVPLGGDILGYAREIEPLFARQQRQNLLLFTVAALTALTFAVVLLITLRQVFRPIDNLAHELRTPLTAIQGYAQYIQLASIDEAERYESARFIADESRRLSAIVDRLLVLANLREGELRRVRISIPALFESARRLYPTLETGIGWDSLWGDPALLQSLVNNLVDNAVKAGPTGARVRLTATERSIAVEDWGAGMDEQTLLRLNDPENRGRASLTGGAGLGVPLCHQIARLHGGRLEFFSEPNKGTLARVLFLQLPDPLMGHSTQQRVTMEGKKGSDPL